jgi:hypothetical protein
LGLVFVIVRPFEFPKLLEYNSLPLHERGRVIA